jgi:hypothetical protein
MHFAKRTFMGFGVVAFMAVLFSLAAPKVVHGIVATLVQVANTSANPVPNADINDPDLATIEVQSCQGRPQIAGLGSFDCGPNFMVPAGKRFVINRLEADCYTLPGNTFSGSYLGLTEGGSPTQHYFAVNTQENGGREYILNQPVRYYADPGSYIVFVAYTSDTSGGTYCNFQADGYLINYP